MAQAFGVPEMILPEILGGCASSGIHRDRPHERGAGVSAPARCHLPTLRSISAWQWRPLHLSGHGFASDSATADKSGARMILRGRTPPASTCRPSDLA